MSDTDYGEWLTQPQRKRYQERHIPQCKRCGRFSPWGTKIMQIHHILPTSKGGTNDESNLVVLCTNCHSICHSPFGSYVPPERFEEWLKEPSLYTWPELEDEHLIGMCTEAWEAIRELRMSTEMYMRPEWKEYTDAHKNQWIDWREP